MRFGFTSVVSSFLFFTILGCSHSGTRELASVQPTATAEQLTQKYREFLINLGFKNYASDMGRVQEDKLYVGEMSKKVVQEQKRNYQIFNFARELAVELVASLYENEDPKNPYYLSKDLTEARRDMATFTAKMLALKPTPPPVPSKAFEKMDEEAQTQYLVEQTNKIIHTHLQNVMSDIMEVLYDRDQIAELIEVIKKDPENPKWHAHLARLQQIRQWMNGILRFIYSNGQMGQTPHLGKALAACLWKYAIDEHLPDYFYKDLYAAVRQQGEGLSLSNYVGDTLRLVDKNQKVIEIKIENGDFLFERPLGRGDHAPAGMAIKYTDAKTNISMLWSADIYPNAGEGGVRLTDIVSQFARPGEHPRLGVSRYDPWLFYQFAKSYYEKNGYKEDVWESAPDDEKDSTDKAHWKSVQTFAGMRAIFSEVVTSTTAKAWYEKFMNKITAHLTNYMLLRGVGFATDFQNILGRAYSISLFKISSLQATGIDLQSTPESWLTTNQRIVNYEQFSEKWRMGSTFVAAHRTMNVQLTKYLKADEGFEKLTTHELGEEEIDDLFGTFYDSVARERRKRLWLQDNPSLGDKYPSTGYIGAAANLIQAKKP